MKASVVIPTFNRCHEIDKVLQGLSHQKKAQTKFEIIVIDDNSNDDTYEIVNNYQELLPIKYIIKNDNINSAARTRNIGIRKANNELIIFLDSDVIPNEYFIASHITAHEAQHRAVVLGYVERLSRSIPLKGSQHR